MVRINNKRTRRTQTQILQDEFNRMLNISTDLYSTKHKDIINNIFNMGLDVYKTKRKENSIMNIVTDLYSTKRKENSIFNVQTDIYKRKKKEKTHVEEKEQLGKARTAIKKHVPLIEFDIAKMKDPDYFYDELANVLYELLDSIELDKDKWVIHYDYGSGWKGKLLDTISERMLRNQIEISLLLMHNQYMINESSI